MIDVSAQILDWAGVALPDYLQGKPFMGAHAVTRNFVYAARDRWDEVYDKIRTVIGTRYKYIRNDMPERGWTFQQDYVERVRPMYPVIRKLIAEGKTTPEQEWFFLPQKPKEELYDLQEDPWELHNLADNPGHRSVKKNLEKKLETWEVETNDQGRYPEKESAIPKRWRKKVREREAQAARLNAEGKNQE